jgi:hypothetical protein
VTDVGAFRYPDLSMTGGAIRIAIALASASAALMAPSVAAGSGTGQPGVYASPGSPSSHEYQIPLTAARTQASGGGGGSSGGGSSPLFGVGITPGKGHAARSRPTRAGGRRNTTTPSASGPGGRGKTTTAAVSPNSSQGSPRLDLSASKGDNGTSAWLPLVGGGLLVLLIGGGGGLALRRRLSHS